MDSRRRVCRLLRYRQAIVGAATNCTSCSRIQFHNLQSRATEALINFVDSRSTMVKFNFSTP